MKRTDEREIKLRAGSGFVMPSGLGDPMAPRAFSSTYHDTPDHRLANTGFTLRYRAEQGTGAWQLKLPENGHRRELELPGSPEQVPQHFGDLVSATTRGRPIAPVATLDTDREGVMVREHGRNVAEVVVDRVVVSRSGRRISQIEELEVELVDGDEESLREIERALRAAGAEPGDGRPKLARALGLPRWTRKPLRRDAVPMRHLTVMLEQQYWAILEHDPGTRLGDDPEHLHQHRVAIRRLRALLRAAKPMLDSDWVKELRGELAWAGKALGDVRDLDVLLDHLHADAETLPAEQRDAFERLTTALSDRRETTRLRMLQTLRSPRYLRLLDRLERDLADPPRRDHEVALAKIVRKQHRKLKHEVRALGSQPTDEALHEVRKTVKHARYAAELAERARGSKAGAYIKATKRLQDVLGEHQDAHVAEATLRELAEGAPAQAAFAVGMLAERQQERRRQARAEFPAAWKAVKRRGRAAWS
jgi:CHAD domain-containing protein